MKILVTGSRGFIGEKLVKSLREEGHYVWEFDIKYGHDILNFEDVKKAVQKNDVVYHLAAIVDESDKNLWKVNVDGTKNVLEASAERKVKQFIYLSTVGVMGNIQGKVNENAPYAPVTKYEKSKAAAEKLVLSYQGLFPVTIIRSALVYGNNSYWQGIVKMVKKGFPVVGSGENKWQLIYVKDLVSALKFILMNEKTFNEIFIVAEKDGKTLNELYELILKSLNLKREITHLPVFGARIMAYLSFLLKPEYSKLLRQEYIDRLIRIRDYDTTKINALGWENNYTTEQGIKEMISEMKLKQLI